MGIIQGITEFLPVSSSGHLVIFQKLFKFDPPSIFFEVLVHFGTLLAIAIVFHKELGEMFSSLIRWIQSGFKKPVSASDESRNLKMIQMILVATVITCILGFTFKDYVEKSFTSVKLTGFMLLITGLILLSSRFIQDKSFKDLGKMSFSNSVIIGIAQTLALLPGISRAGTTISTGMFLKLERDLAARFSFFIAIPAVLGAVALKSLDLTPQDFKMLPSLLPGFIASIVTGVLAIKILLRHISGGKFWLYSFWCFTAGLLTIILL